ncbi:hypothetical protein B0H16DRAFT_1461401 [Mycena metata]|uniref:Uncharacterized protein n=1 Tax=Mycena metata TaxID=1033252 RepID=A0AAD7IRA7_9AGAR|nr:hypothetical protein B0H16DRAFT_1461401 [Mycena metata]
MGGRRGGQRPANPAGPPSVSLVRGGNGSVRAHATTPGKAPRGILGNGRKCGPPDPKRPQRVGLEARRGGLQEARTKSRVWARHQRLAPGPKAGRSLKKGNETERKRKGGRSAHVRLHNKPAVDDAEQARKGRGSGGEPFVPHVGVVSENPNFATSSKEQKIVTGIDP